MAYAAEDEIVLGSEVTGPRPDIDKALQALRLFNEKAEKLETLGFTERIRTQETRVTLQFQGEGGITGEREGPDRESIDAFVLTLRFFVQDNEPSSLRRMAKMYEELRAGKLVSDSLVEKFNQARDGLNAYLDTGTHLTFIEEKSASSERPTKRYTRREAFDIFLWGELAHSNKKAKHDEWRKLDFVYEYFQYELVRVLMEFLRTVVFVRRLNESAIEELQNKP